MLHCGTATLRRPKPLANAGKRRDCLRPAIGASIVFRFWGEHREGRMIPRERAPSSAIIDRPPLKLPNRARLVVWTIVNLEFWDIARPMARQVLPAPTGQVLLPDVANWSWHAYGLRLEGWRFFHLFLRLALRPPLSIDARVCEDYERLDRPGHEAGS